jgi:FAD/FMN-containing dehydrogenase
VVSSATTTRAVRSWGRVHRYRHTLLRPRTLDELGEALPSLAATRPVLAFGLGRSYGDSCLNEGGILVDMSGLDRIERFDSMTGELLAEAGLSLGELLRRLCRPDANGSAWFLPVTPGTRFVTLGGAVANDVHGKNHHRQGTFGHHVTRLELLRSDGSRIWCGPAENPGLFRATVGGLGLTGIITRVAMRLRRVDSLVLDVEDIRLDGLDGFWPLAAGSEASHEYTVGWIDCQADGATLGRGIWTRAVHAPPGTVGPGTLPDPAPRWRVPFGPPVSPLNRLTLRAFNALHRARLRGERRRRRTGYVPALYPLDALGGWNRLYGPRGFHQYQCVVPKALAREAVRELLQTIAASGQGSFLAVLKTMGSRPSLGLLSFAMEGTTLALDFPNRGAATLALLDRLDRITEAAGGRVYIAKDGRMSAESFARFYPGWAELQRWRDPGIDSSFARRVGRAFAAPVAARLPADLVG